MYTHMHPVFLCLSPKYLPIKQWIYLMTISSLIIGLCFPQRHRWPPWRELRFSFRVLLLNTSNVGFSINHHISFRLLCGVILFSAWLTKFYRKNFLVAIFFGRNAVPGGKRWNFFIHGYSMCIRHYDGELTTFILFLDQRSLATDLQKLSMELRKKQSAYLKRLRQQKEVCRLLPLHMMRPRIPLLICS